LSPVRGWERLRSGESLQRALWAVLRFGGFLAIAATFLAVFGDRIVSSGMGTPGRLMRTSWRFSLSMVALLGGMSLVLGLADYVTRWLRHEAQLRMTRAELKQELKEDQGDPQIRATIRRLQRERLKRRSLREVPQATLVLTNPTHVAVALRYDPGSVRAPRVLAKGTGELAQRIKQIARLHDVPVVENPPLARALYKSVEIQQEIPVEYYRAVAEILARLFRERSAA
jgi:flagellar biosynthetic protein FlhB